MLKKIECNKKFWSLTIFGLGALEAQRPIPKLGCITNQGERIVINPNNQADNTVGCSFNTKVIKAKYKKA